MKSRFRLEDGAQIEMWACGPGFIRIVVDDDCVWQVPALPNHPAFFRYHHREAGTVEIEWDRSEAILWAYDYDPARVVETGIAAWEVGSDTITRRMGPEIDAWTRSDPDRPQMHFSPICNWMNDPNGLCRIGDIWHLFYQFHPASAEWGPMHWGHATSTDLVTWIHLPVFLHPEQNYWQLGATGGAFSGTAFCDRDGAQMFFYTERLPAYDLVKGYREVQKLARPDRNLIHAEYVSTVIENRPQGVEHDFRDPKVWWDATAGAYRMILGAALHGDPAVLLYGSDNLVDWTYLGPLYRAPARYRTEGARAVECPDFFALDGHWVLVMGFVGHTEPESGRHNLLYGLVGDYANDRFVPHSDDLQLLDFGTDFYAMQSMGTNDQRAAFAWVFNWEDRKPPGSTYSGEMSLPRDLSIDDRKRLCMRPSRAFLSATTATPIGLSPNGSCVLDDVMTNLRLTGPLNGTRILATQNEKPAFEIEVENGIIRARLPRDDGHIAYAAEIGDSRDLQVFFDRGILEIFAEKGAVCGTRRSYLNIKPDRLVIRSQACCEVFSITA